MREVVEQSMERKNWKIISCRFIKTIYILFNKYKC